MGLARKIGSADIFLSTEKEDIVKRTMKLTNGRGAYVVIELAGVGSVGLPAKPVEIE